TSVARVASNCHWPLMHQERTRCRGGSHTTTPPPSHSLPSMARSNPRPFTNGSMMAASGGRAAVGCVYTDHHCPTSAAYTSKAPLVNLNDDFLTYDRFGVRLHAHHPLCFTGHARRAP